ncbi:MAG: hypothetical protein M3Y78_13835 [Pseudomonadota bacterium]|nr:hypothetical protein [Pseudomonadota bacterium]
MRIMLTVAALVLFVVSTGLLEIARPQNRPMTTLPPAMGNFGQTKVDATVTSSITLQHLDEQ